MGQIVMIFKFLEDDGFGNMQKLGVTQRLRRHHIRCVEKHDCFAETLTLIHDFDDLFVALR
jgi:hypothetical protein